MQGGIYKPLGMLGAESMMVWWAKAGGRSLKLSVHSKVGSCLCVRRRAATSGSLADALQGHCLKEQYEFVPPCFQDKSADLTGVVSRPPSLHEG